MSRIERYLFGVFLAISYCYFFQHAEALATDPREVTALRVIRSNLIDPWKNLDTWNSGDPCTSSWRGILCYAPPNDGYLHVNELLLLNLNLSGNLAPEIGLLSHLRTLDFMWNNISGSIPKEIGNISSLTHLLLNGNRLSGSLPEELGDLPNLDRLQIDENQISGSIPKSFANLKNTRHFHMNNNSLSGQIPSELSKLSAALHLLLDNNNLSGPLPPELSRLPILRILQLDNNNFSGSFVPASYANMSTLYKLGLRNCSLQGAIPDFSRIPEFMYLDLSWNKLTGSIPSNKLSENITTIDLSNNFLNGSIPSSFAGLPNLQKLSLKNNLLHGSVPSHIWQDIYLNRNESLILDFENNSLTNSSDFLSPPANVTILLYGNPVCADGKQTNIRQFCQPQDIAPASGSVENAKISCSPCPTDMNYEYNPLSPIPCICAVPLGVGFRLKSPSISDFRPYIFDFKTFLTSRLNLSLYQLYIESYAWEEGPRLRMSLKLFPNNTSLFALDEILQIRSMFTRWEITFPGLFGPYELLNFTLGSYAEEIPDMAASVVNKSIIAGIVVGAFAGACFFSVLVAVLIKKQHSRHHGVSRRRLLSSTRIKIDGVKGFTFEEMALATDNFSISTQLGQGGYGKVYKGILADGTIVAIKRAQEGSLHVSSAFFTEIEFLSRVHHRNVVSLAGYCNEEAEQMLVYEFMPNGTLGDHLFTASTKPLNFSMRLSIALGSARGILYLHTEADPPIFHRDIKSSNILLDSSFIAKVADFGLSRLAPVSDIDGGVSNSVSTVVKGTPGYLDPEYFLTHKLTDKSDVYSLGVVFLELLTGMKPILHGKNIVREVSNSCQSGSMFSIIDSRMSSYDPGCVGKFLSLALECCRDDPNSRPSMSEVVRELEAIQRMVPEIDTSISVSQEADSHYLTSSTSSSSSRLLSSVSNDFGCSISGIDAR